MHAVLLQEAGRLEDCDVPEPREPEAGEALVAVRRVGICGTDFHAFAGIQNFFAYPRVLGHELAVEVLALGPPADSSAGHDEPSGPQAGDLCAVLPYLPCGVCAACRRGRANCCDRLDVLGVTVDGGLCERLVVPVAALHTRPGLSLDQLALVETLGIGMHAVARAQPQSWDTALIIGAGPIGLAIAQCLGDQIGSIAITDLSADRLTFAEQTMKVNVLEAGEDLEAQRLYAGGELPSLIFDATGSRTSMERAFRLVGSGGKLILVGHTTGSLTFGNPGFHRRELDVRASRNALAAEWDSVLDQVAAASLDALPWISHRSSLPSVTRDLPALAAGSPALIKTLVDVNGERTS